jgi:P27 family predicted phage terminase small subunit
MPRRSAASFSILSVTGAPPRLTPPPELTGRARKIFLDAVASLRPGHFVPSDRPLLIEYCRAVALADEAYAALAVEGAVITSERGSKVSPWVTVQEKAQRAMTALSHRLRLSPQGRSPTLPTRPARQASYFERMELEGVRDDDDAAGTAQRS